MLFPGPFRFVSVSVDGIGVRVSPFPVPLIPPYIFIVRSTEIKKKTIDRSGQSAITQSAALVLFAWPYSFILYDYGRMMVYGMNVDGFG